MRLFFWRKRRPYFLNWPSSRIYITNCRFVQNESGECGIRLG